MLQDMSIKSIKEEIDRYVTKVMFNKRKPPAATDGRYFPDEAKISIIKYFTYNLYVIQSSMVDHLKKHFQKLRNEFGAEVTFKIDHVDLQNTELQNLKTQKIYLFHQSKSQQYLLNRYGAFVYIAEVKLHKNSSHAVSLFLICVRTNVDCQVVGTILCNKYNDHAKILKEALTEFKKINKFWKPKYLMLDPTEAMVAAVEELFPGTILRFLLLLTALG